MDTLTPSQMPSMVTRMTAILDTFRTAGQRRSLQDVSTLTGLPRSTVHRILEQLTELGWVEHGMDGYHLGWRATTMPTQADEDARLREAATTYANELAMHSKLVVHLAVLDGPHVRYLDKIGGNAATGIPSRVGGRLPAHLTAVGKAMLAQMTPESLDIILEHSTTVYPDLSSMLVHRELAAIRRRGHSFDRDGSLAPVTCVGAAIFGDDGRVVGGLSVCDGGSGAPLERFVPLLIEGAKRATGRLTRVVRPGTTTHLHRPGSRAFGLPPHATPLPSAP